MFVFKETCVCHTHTNYNNSSGCGLYIMYLVQTKKIVFLQVIIGGSNLDCVVRLDVDEIKVNITSSYLYVNCLTHKLKPIIPVINGILSRVLL